MKARHELRKAFAIQQILPYYKDRSLCAIGSIGCEYLTDDGRMCVVGKNLINPEKFVGKGGKAVDQLLSEHGESILKAYARDILSVKEWGYLQVLHDTLAGPNDEIDINNSIKRLGLFTIEELEDYAKL